MLLIVFPFGPLGSHVKLPVWQHLKDLLEVSGDDSSLRAILSVRYAPAAQSRKLHTCGLWVMFIIIIIIISRELEKKSFPRPT